MTRGFGRMEVEIMFIVLRSCSCDLVWQDGEFAEGLILKSDLDAEVLLTESLVSVPRVSQNSWTSSLPKAKEVVVQSRNCPSENDLRIRFLIKLKQNELYSIFKASLPNQPSPYLLHRTSKMRAMVTKQRNVGYQNEKGNRNQVEVS